MSRNQLQIARIRTPNYNRLRTGCSALATLATTNATKCSALATLATTNATKSTSYNLRHPPPINTRFTTLISCHHHHCRIHHQLQPISQKNNPNEAIYFSIYNQNLFRNQRLKWMNLRRNMKLFSGKNAVVEIHNVCDSF